MPYLDLDCLLSSDLSLRICFQRQSLVLAQPQEFIFESLIGEFLCLER